MNSLIDEVDPDEPRSNTDLTLGVGSLLSIFFGVVLICGIFFGFGYSMGRRNTHTASETGTATAKAPQPAPEPAIPSRELSSEPLKPQLSESTAASPETPAPAAAKEQADTSSAATADRAPRKAAATQPDAEEAPKSSRPARVVEPSGNDTALTAVPYTHRPTLPAKPHAGILPPPEASATAAPAAEPTPGHPVMVQIAAVSRQEDAEVLAGALRKRGFSPSVRPGTTDKFFHVQVGPFTNKADAESMKQHLLADGYNAIVK
jgi:DedD protein